MEPFRYHVFVCTQEKAEGVPCCSAAGSFRVLTRCTASWAPKVCPDEVQVSSCGCLGICDSGPVMIVYPEGTWYTKLTPADVTEIVGSHFQAGKKVARLERDDSAEMKAEILDHRNKYLAMLKGKDAAGVLPDDVNELIRGFMPSRAVLTALELDVFTAVGNGGTAHADRGKDRGGGARHRDAAERAGQPEAAGKARRSLHQHADVGALLRRGHTRQRSRGATAHREHVEALVHSDRSGEGGNVPSLLAARTAG